MYLTNIFKIFIMYVESEKKVNRLFIEKRAHSRKYRKV